MCQSDIGQGRQREGVRRSEHRSARRQVNLLSADSFVRTPVAADVYLWEGDSLQYTASLYDRINNVPIGDWLTLVAGPTDLGMDPRLLDGFQRTMQHQCHTPLL